MVLLWWALGLALVGGVLEVPCRAGGRKDPSGMKSETLVRADLLNQEIHEDVRPWMGIRDWLGERNQFLLSSIAESTNKQYSYHWHRWTSFTTRKEVMPLLTREGSRADLVEEENLLLDFALVLNHLGNAPDTIRNTLSGVRFHHVSAGYPDPLLGRPRLTMMLKGLKRMAQKGGRKKFPITARMMAKMHWALFSESNEAEARRGVAQITKADTVIVWAGMVVAWMFLLRGGEWLAHDGRGYDMAKVIIGAGVKALSEAHAVVNWIDALQVAIEVRASKVDQMNLGTWRNHFASGKLVCPVEALKALQRLFPQRFKGGSEESMPLFRRANGHPLWRSQVQGLVDWAAETEGLPPARFGSHSFRIGGATALLHAGVQIEVIKRWGRWVSDSFQRYLWDANEDARGLSTRMAMDRSTLVNTR